jgi:hypothetical protein
MFIRRDAALFVTLASLILLPGNGGLNYGSANLYKMFENEQYKERV